MGRSSGLKKFFSYRVGICLWPSLLNIEADPEVGRTPLKPNLAPTRRNDVKLTP